MREENGRYTILPAGADIAEALADDVPRSVRDAAVRATLAAQQFARKEAQHHAQITPAASGTGYNVQCSIRDMESDVFSFSLYVPDKLTAKLARAQFIENGDGIYKLDYNKVLEYHIEKKADITVVCKDMEDGTDVTRFGCVKLNDDGRITDFEEKPMASDATTISCGIYVIRRRQLIELLERCAAEDRYDLVNDILVRYKNLKRIYAYKLNGYWNNIASVDSYYKTNMDFLKPEVRDYFFKQYPDVYTKIDDLPPAKYNPGAIVRNSLISSGCILNGTVENSILFKKAYVGNNCVIKNSIILNDVYIGDNTVIENCIVESRDTIRANTTHIGTPENIKIVVEKNERYTL